MPIFMNAGSNARVGTAPIVLGGIPRRDADHTAVSFQVQDIASAIRTLKAAGVVFEDYDYPTLKTVEHVCVLGSEKAAWFSDPDGNILCIHEDLR